MNLKTKLLTKDNPRLWLVFLLLLPWVINSARLSSSDFEVFTATAKDWLSGETQLYDATHVYYNYLPWSLVIYIPFVIIPEPYNLLLFNTLTLGLLIWSTWNLIKPMSWWVLAISLTTLYTGMHLLLGQWDALVLAGLSLGWLGVQRKNPWIISIALVLMTTKYTNIILPLIILLYSIRRWSIKDLIRVSILPIITVFLSFFIAGWDWPLRYSHLIRTIFAIYDQYESVTIFARTAYQSSYWRYIPPYGNVVLIILAICGIYLIIRLVRKQEQLDSILLATSLNLVISPYLAPQHLVYLAPVQAQLLKKNLILGFILYGSSILDLFFMWLGIGIFLYPLTALVVFMAYAVIELRKPKLNSMQQYLDA